MTCNAPWFVQIFGPGAYEVCSRKSEAAILPSAVSIAVCHLQDIVEQFAACLPEDSGQLLLQPYPDAWTVFWIRVFARFVVESGGWRASFRVRWFVRRFRFGPQSGSHGRVSVPRSPSPARQFPAPSYPDTMTSVAAGRDL